MKAKPKTTYVTASPATWELIRAAYLSGQSAPTAAARFGVSVSGLRKRAAREGWTKRAYVAGGAAGLAPLAVAADATTPPLPGEEPTLAELHARAVPPPRHDPIAVARMAMGHAARCLIAGEADLALRHVRAATAIVGLERQLEQGGYDSDENPLEAEARQSAFDEFVFQVAGDLAGRLLTGQGIPSGMLARAERWRETYADALAAEAAATEAEA
ncbi:MAG: hypothetical protein V4466_00565 [Pseudomonadota bacterium]